MAKLRNLSEDEFSSELIARYEDGSNGALALLDAGADDWYNLK